MVLPQGAGKAIGAKEPEMYPRRRVDLLSSQCVPDGVQDENEVA